VKSVFISLYLIVVKILLSASHFMVLLGWFGLEKSWAGNVNCGVGRFRPGSIQEEWGSLLIGREEAAGFVEELEEFGAVAEGVGAFAFEGELADLVPGEGAAVGALAEHEAVGGDGGGEFEFGGGGGEGGFFVGDGDFDELAGGAFGGFVAEFDGEEFGGFGCGR
jgi:hypothetical protein